MSLTGPWLNTTSTKKPAQKISKAKQAELQQGWHERNERLKGMKLPKESFEQYLDFVYGRSNKKKENTTSKAKAHTKRVSEPGRDVGEYIPSLNTNVSGACASKPSPTYTGEKMIGISIIHKSCLQPIFNKEDAVDAANMRR